MVMPEGVSESSMCEGGLCVDEGLPYERISQSQPGYQWNDAGGYCGSWATQRAVLSKGAWISQQQVRDATSPCGGNDNEILSCNIDEAWTNLKLDYDGFDFEGLPTPQTEAYLSWLKGHLTQGNAVAWMILWSGQSYPIYDLTPPAGMYGHVEPVIGIQSNHPLNDTKVYADDVILHYTDGGVNTVHRQASTIAGTWGGEGEKADCGDYDYCISNPWGFGWAIQGFNDEKDYVQASLKIDPWLSEPDTRSGEDPDEIQGTLTATGLEVGATYDIYRWDSVKEAMTYADEYKKITFEAQEDTYVYIDDKSFMSDSATYYRVVKV
ncbi:hypothetical protein TrCOL_g8065 [Triparma columacea]|uniref:Peptidase C39-like domain-containing protein n=1 Tax=Triparma columacea TaxID=722753 RepID=A0A9W7GNU5_9STRA|nr:hypothetical protein TrCOL_g8065 [Triparma columacea]